MIDFEFFVYFFLKKKVDKHRFLCKWMATIECVLETGTYPATKIVCCQAFRFEYFFFFVLHADFQL